VVSGKLSTRRQILAYSLLLFPAGLAPAFVGLAGPLYIAVATLFGGWMIWESVAVLREQDASREPAARRLFAVSISYLFVLFAALIAEHLLGIAPFGTASFGAWM